MPDLKNRLVLFTTSAHQLIHKRLEDAGYTCHLHPDLTIDEANEIIAGYEGIIVNSRFVIDSNMLDKAKKLRFIGRIGSGMESIDTLYASKRGIQCFNSPEGNRDAVGEHAIGLLLMMINRLNIADSQVKAGCWEREGNRGTEIKGKTVAIIGYGNTGSAFARKLSGFEAKVLAYDKYKTAYSDLYAKESGMEEIFTSADILSLHVPLTVDTKYLVDSNFIGRFAKPIWLLNTSRGSVIKTDDLVKELINKKVTGAALDVLEYEEDGFGSIDFENAPPALLYLQNSEKVVLSPHIAGWTIESGYKLAAVLADKIIAASGK